MHRVLAAVTLSAAVIFLLSGSARAQTSIDDAGRILAIVERGCLSGSGSKYGASVDIKISGLKEILTKGSAGTLKGDAFKTEVKGAVDFAKDELKKAENDSIRNCIMPRLDRILEMLIERTSSFLDLRLRVDFRDPRDPNFEPNSVTVGSKYPRYPEERNWHPQPPDQWFSDLIPMLPRGGPSFNAWISRTRRTATYTQQPETHLCLVRAPADPDYEPVIRLVCTEGAKCKHHDRDNGWAAFCDGYNAASADPQPSRGWSLIGTAHAQPALAALWSVPSLAVLERRRTGKDLKGTGYTEFMIEGLERAPDGADAMTLDLAVNGQPVRIDGLPPEALSYPLAPGANPRLSFGLENLNFAGRDGGCDEISATLRFQREGQVLGSPIGLKRLYIALRDSDSMDLISDSRRYRWTGRYVRPEPSFDYEVLVQSAQVKSLHDAAEVANARKYISALRVRANDQVRGSFQGRPITFVVRPPLAKPDAVLERKGFGLAAGIVEETGQIRFTFTRTDANALKQVLLGLNAPSSLVHPSTFVYAVNKEFPNPPGICDGARG